MKFTEQGRTESSNPSARLPIVSSDVDGVHANWTREICEIAGKMTGRTISWQDWVQWAPWTQDPPLISKELFEAAFAHSLETPEFYLNMRPFEDIRFDVIERDLRGGMYNLYFVTHRANLSAPTGAQDATQLLKRWLNKMGVPSATGVIAGHHERAALLKMLNVDYHLDDYLGEFEKCTAAGIDTYLMDRPWNRSNILCFYC